MKAVLAQFILLALSVAWGFWPPKGREGESMVISAIFLASSFLVCALA